MQEGQGGMVGRQHIGPEELVKVSAQDESRRRVRFGLRGEGRFAAASIRKQLGIVRRLRLQTGPPQSDCPCRGTGGSGAGGMWG